MLTFESRHRPAGTETREGRHRRIAQKAACRVETRATSSLYLPNV